MERFSTHIASETFSLSLCKIGREVLLCQLQFDGDRWNVCILSELFKQLVLQD